MKKFSILILCIIFNACMYAAANRAKISGNLQPDADTSVSDFFSCLRIVGAAPDISGQYAEGEFAVRTGFFSHERECATACFLVGHEDENVRGEILDDIITEPRYYECAKGRDSSPMSPSSLQEEILKKAYRAHYTRFTHEQLTDVIAPKDPFVAAIFLSCKAGLPCKRVDMAMRVFGTSVKYGWHASEIDLEAAYPMYFYAWTPLHDYFFRQPNVIELFRRYRAGELPDKELLVFAFHTYLKERRAFGFVLDIHELRAYFEKRMSSSARSRL